jgi:ribonuclease P protein component
VGLRQTQRLRHRREIAAVNRRGRPQRSELVTVRVLRTNLPIARFGFAVGGSVGNAVVRNRVRRRLREIVASLGVAQGWDLMLSARPGAARVEFKELRKAVAEVLRRAGVLERRVTGV